MSSNPFPPQSFLDQCPPNCIPQCDRVNSVFDRVSVRHYTRGGTIVFWELLPTFTDPGPLIFQLQIGETSNPDSNDWVNIGSPVINQYYTIDPEQRAWGSTRYRYYRVQVTSLLGTYYSAPVNGLGLLNKKEWLLARELIRQRKVLYRKGYAAVEGYLLKRRITGQFCSRCVDSQTREVKDSDCPECFGTGYYCGYFYPMSCVWAIFEPKTYRIEIDDQGVRGTVNDVAVKADMITTDFMSESDIFVADRSDDRFFIHRVQHTAEVRGVPIAGQVEMRLIPYNNIVYTIDIPQRRNKHLVYGFI